ncbi:MAG: DEAD/DEAH box helicase [Prevotella sp.]|nr:DEAD/DEAH box helicase [Prevotella sp.]
MTTFHDLKISEPVLKALQDKRYINPTPIQQQAIPVALTGSDLLGIAQTGTGKTAAFTIPIIQQLMAELADRQRRPRALVLTPTRELAIQIEECVTDYAKYTRLRSCVIFGGVNQKPQVAQLNKGVDLLIATPGRLLDLISQRLLTLDSVRHFVLDEADRMLDMGFVHDIRRIIPLLPKQRQTMLFSATMPKTIADLSQTILHRPRRVEVAPVASVVDTIEQHLYMVEKPEKVELLVQVLNKRRNDTALVFSRTKHGADKIARKLKQRGISCDAIHGNKSQNARQRALENFKTHKTRVIIATDIAARGIDIDGLQLVVNFDLPDVPETYVHRIGRTGRAGHSGQALTFCSKEEYAMVRDIQKLTGRRLNIVQ